MHFAFCSFELNAGMVLAAARRLFARSAQPARLIAARPFSARLPTLQAPVTVLEYLWCVLLNCGEHTIITIIYQKHIHTALMHAHVFAA